MAPHWPIIVPALLTVIAILWLLLVYNRKKFSFLPALAIARVTVLDSIGRMEVIILLAIGMMLVGVNGIIPNTLEGNNILNTWMDEPYFQDKLNELSGGASFTLEEDFRPVNTPEDDVLEQADTSTVEVEPVINVDDPRRDIITRAEELRRETQQNTLQALIWQGAFLVADVFVALIGFVLAMMVLPGEINRGVILSILPKPITREEYIFGKALGIWIIVSGCYLILAIELFGIRAIFDFINGTNSLDFRVLMALFLFPMKYATLVLIVMGLTLRMPEVPAGIVGAALFATGHFADRIYDIATTPDINAMIGYGMKFSYWILPHLSPVTFSILDRDASLISTQAELWGWIWQITIYNILLLKLLSWLFKRRSL